MGLSASDRFNCPLHWVSSVWLLPTQVSVFPPFTGGRHKLLKVMSPPPQQHLTTPLNSLMKPVHQFAKHEGKEKRKEELQYDS